MTIANYFVEKAKEDGINLTILKLMKIVYIAHGWHLGYSGKPLIDEPAEAWQYGPVIRSLYKAFSEYGRDEIRRPASSDMPTAAIADGDTHNLPGFLDAIWEAYKGYTAGQLVEMTHRDDSPWYKEWVLNKGMHKTTSFISNEDIKDYYERRRRSTE